MRIILLFLFFSNGLLIAQHQPHVWALDAFKEQYGTVSLDKALKSPNNTPLSVNVTFPLISTGEEFVRIVLASSKPTLLFRMPNTDDVTMKKTIVIARDVSVHAAQSCQIALIGKNESDAILEKLGIALKNSRCEVIFYQKGIMYELTGALKASVLVNFVKNQLVQHP